MPSIIILGKKYSYTIVRKSIASLGLRLKSRRSFIVSSPRLLPEFMITSFVKQHQDWVVKNSLKFSRKLSLKKQKNLQILDESYELIIKKSSMDSVVIFKDEHKIYANTSSLSSVHLRKLLDAKFRIFALTLITLSIKELSYKYHFNYHRISVKNTTSRFGSCSSTNNLNFNWQIILFPINIFRHILLHELTHTIHHNHSAKFWQQLETYDPDWKTNRRYLRVHGQKHFIV